MSRKTDPKKLAYEMFRHHFDMGNDPRLDMETRTAATRKSADYMAAYLRQAGATKTSDSPLLLKTWPQAPKGYSPPTSLTELVARFENGERYFADIHIADPIGLRDAIFKDCDFSGANFMDCPLEGTTFELCRFREVSFKNASLPRAAFKRCQFENVLFTGADCPFASFEGCEGTDVDFSRAKLPNADFSRARFGGCNYSGAVLQQATFLDAVVPKCDFSDAGLFAASFEQADLKGCNLSRSTLEAADLSGADCRDSRSLVLNNNRVTEARFSTHGGAAPTWIKLKVSYTGVRALFHILLFLAFLAPLIARAGFWVGINRLETVLPFGKQLAATNGNEIPPLPAGVTVKRYRIWQLLLSMDKSLRHSAPAVLLLLYNVLRALLTYNVGPLRDEEEVTGYCPALSDYRLLVAAHRVFSILLIAALALAAHELFEALSSEVWMLTAV